MEPFTATTVTRLGHRLTTRLEGFQALRAHLARMTENPQVVAVEVHRIAERKAA